MEISDIVNLRHVAFNLFITHFYIVSIFFLQKSRTLFSATYISVVIDCTFSNNVTEVTCFILKYHLTSKHSQTNNIMK